MITWELIDKVLPAFVLIHYRWNGFFEPVNLEVMSQLLDPSRAAWLYPIRVCYFGGFQSFKASWLT
jgi:hypothetical protein